MKNHVIKLQLLNFFSGEKKNLLTTQRRTMYTIVKNSPKHGTFSTSIKKIPLSNYYKHCSDTFIDMYNNTNTEKILADPQNNQMHHYDIVRTLLHPQPYPVELNLKVNILQTMYPYPIFSRNTFLDCMKNQGHLPNGLTIKNPLLDKKVNVNFIAEAYLISNTNIDYPKIIDRHYYNEKDDINTKLSMQHCRQEHCDGQFILSFDNTDIKKMVDVKLSRLIVDQGSRIYPVIVDMEKGAFTGIRNEPYSFKDYIERKSTKIVELQNQYKNTTNNVEITYNLQILDQILNEKLDFYRKLKLIQEQQHKLFCIINKHNLDIIKPRYNPEILYVTTGTYKEEHLPDILKSVHKQRMSLGTIFKSEHPEIYKNMGLCKNTLWGWDNTYLDKIEFDIFL